MKIRIRTKLAAALAVPLLALVAISGFEAVQAAEDAEEVKDETELARVSIGPSSLTTELQNERNLLALDLIGLAEAATLEVSSPAEARERVDESVEALRSFLSGRDEIALEAFAPAFEALEADLAETRALYDDYDGPKDLENEPLANEVFERFTVMTEAFFDATESVATEVDENALRNGIEIVDNSNRRGELLATLTRAVVLDTLTDGGEDAYRAEVAAQLARLDTLEDRIKQLSVGPYADVAEETLDRTWDVETREHFVSYLAGEEVDIAGLLEDVSAGGAEGVVSASEMASGILDTEASRLTSEAEDRREQFMLLAVGVIAIAVLSSWLASRSITRPLRKLRSEAAEMAEHRLPDALGQILETPLGEDITVPDLDPIVVQTRDEVHEVVDVLNDVQDRTLSLAADQAVLRRNIADSFVNLGRRNQNLLDRQLQFITELEENETEPEELESLFQLDHLATRMRRNAESLLVLAGVESPRQWSAPVHFDDVVRAALGEVEDYRRITIRHLDPAMVGGTAAAGISHVLAELMENALNYSPPTAPVEIKGRHDANGYTIAIDDDGIGMSAEDLERANRRLSGEESYTVAPSRYLGHYVAGNLATRFGITVRLRDCPAGGVTATVAIPTALIVPPAGESQEGPAAPPAVAVAEGAAATDPELLNRDRVAAAPPTGSEPPGSLAEALGTSELASIDSVQDLTRAIDGEPDAPAGPTTFSTGLPRRVPGAQRPDLAPTVARRQEPTEPRPNGTGHDEPTRGRPAAPEPEPAPSDGAPEQTTGAFGFLAGYSAAASNGVGPETPVPDTPAPEAWAPENQAAETPVPGARASEPPAPETAMSEAPAPEAPVPEATPDTVPVNDEPVNDMPVNDMPVNGGLDDRLDHRPKDRPGAHLDTRSQEDR